MINTEKQKTKNNYKQRKNGVGNHKTQWGPPGYNSWVANKIQKYKRKKEIKLNLSKDPKNKG